MDQTKDPGSHDHALSPRRLCPAPDGGDAFTKVPIHRKFLKQPPSPQPPPSCATSYICTRSGTERNRTRGTARPPSSSLAVINGRGCMHTRGRPYTRERIKGRIFSSLPLLPPSALDGGTSSATSRSDIEFPRGSTVVNPSVRMSATPDPGGPRITRAKSPGGG